MPYLLSYIQNLVIEELEKEQLQECLHYLLYLEKKDAALKPRNKGLKRQLRQRLYALQHAADLSK